jgi:diguanylate cyclase (GGDEF)-like protein
MHDASNADGGRRESDRPRSRGLPLPLLIVGVGLAGLAVLIASVVVLAQSPPAVGGWAGICVLLGAALLAERFPVPIAGVNAGGVSLAAVFIVGAGYLYGFAPAVLIGCLTRGVFEVMERRRLSKVVYNCSTYSLAGALAGLAAHAFPNTQSVQWLIVDALLGAVAFYLANVVLIASVIACSARTRLGPVLAQTLRSTGMAFSIMFSVLLMLNALWERSPILAAALLGPLIAIALYQRSSNGERRAMELALTDPLTGLGNYRHFHDRLERLLDGADDSGEPVSLCVFDLDDFKTINDTYGHPFGDQVLAEVAEGLRRDGEGFRLGGDEFALLLPDCNEEQALTIVSRVIGRVAERQAGSERATTVSAGVATYPGEGISRSQFVRAADRALYTAKASGRNAVRGYRPGVIELSERRTAEEGDRRARLNAASSLARAIEARDAYTGDHSLAVGNLAARLALRVGLSAEEAELVRLAGGVHDLGKLAIAQEVLCKPGPLSPGERRAVETHSEIGYRMLTSLGIEPVATWVLHHHERWDGSGYPGRLCGDAIPIGSRILLVADAYEAMTSDRVYRGRMTHDEALAELTRCAGTQFDPQVVEALFDELAFEAAAPQVAAAAG